MASEDVHASMFTGNVATFTGNLYTELLNYAEDKNIGVCPVTLCSLLGLVRSGAHDDTAQEIRKALNLPQNPKDIEAVIKNMIPILKKGKNFDYRSGKKIYLRSNYPIKKDYKTIAEEVYEIGLEHLDFAQQAAAAKTINDFIESATQREITHLVQASDVDSASQMVLVCVVVLKLHLTKFQKDVSVKKPFIIAVNKSVTVEFIEKNSIYQYCEISHLKAKMIELPLEAKNLELVIVLPDEPDGLDLIEKEITRVFHKQKFVEQRVNVMIPKFRVECSMDMRRVFQRLGMKKAFIAEADLGGIIAEKRELFISHVFHKTVITFDDELTVSGSIKPVGSVKKMSSSSKSFIADRPFIFYVKLKDLIIFAGRIKNPTQYCRLII